MKSRLVDYLRRERLNHVLAQLSRLKIAVVGDIALDAYWYADMRRALLSRETPRFPRPIIREVYSPGAGGNVAVNLKTLGVGRVIIFSVFGRDHWAALLQDVLSRAGIDTREIVSAVERCTNVYIKPILLGYQSQQEDARLDFENASPLSDAYEVELLQRLERHLPSLDALLIADQFEVNGVITERVRLRLSSLAAAYPEKVFLVDSRQNIGQFDHCYLKPNQFEAEQAFERISTESGNSAADLPELGRRLSGHVQRPVFITLGGKGALACTTERQERIPAAPVTPPLDPVGAGDAFQAALSAALCAGASPWEAVAFANLAAAVTVEKLLQTGAASPEEIIQRYAIASKAANDETV